MTSKYAHLPGLAVDQPDVFESTPDRDADLVHAHTPESAPERSSLDIERGNIDAKTAFDRFRSSGNAVAYTTVVSSNGLHTDETIAEMLKRLTRETDALADRIRSKKEAAKPFQGPGVDDEGASATEMAEGLRLLENNLKQLQTESEALVVRPRSSDVSNIDADRLLVRLKNFKAASSRAVDKAEKTHATDHVQYELTYTPERVAFNQQSKIMALEDRLQRLERVVGSISVDDGSRDPITGAMPAGPLTRKVAELHDQLSAMTPEGAAVAERRLVMLVAQVEKQLATRSTDQLDAQKMAKVQELYTMIHRWDAVASTIPLLTDRLVALRKTHDDAARAARALNAVEAAQVEMQASLSSHKHVLKELSGNLEANVKQTLDNFEALGSRLSKVEQAIKASA